VGGLVENDIAEILEGDGFSGCCEGEACGGCTAVGTNGAVERSKFGRDGGGEVGMVEGVSEVIGIEGGDCGNATPFTEGDERC
jgi:hypothetical protein